MKRLKLHLLNNINPLLPDANPVSCAEVTSSQAHDFKFSELELVTVRHLTSRISCSFTVGSAGVASLADNSSSQFLCSFPIFLVGVLKFNVSAPGLVVVDQTASIPCEVKVAIIYLLHVYVLCHCDNLHRSHCF